MKHQSEKKIVDKNEFLRRVKDLSRENLKFVFSVAKAISLSAATIVFFNVLVDFGNSDLSWQSVEYFIIKLFLGLISCCCVIVTYDGAIFGTLFIYHIPRKSETILTFLLAGFEFLLFAILFPNFFLDNKGVQTIFSIQVMNFWFLVFGAYSLCANGIIRNALSNIKTAEFDEVELQELVGEYKRRMKNEVYSSLGLGLGSIIVFILLFFFDGSSAGIYIKAIAIIISAIGMWQAFNDQHDQRKRIEHLLKRF